MTRALVLVNRIPFPLDDGWKVRTFQLLRAVAQSLPTTIICYGSGSQDAFLRALGGDVTLRLVPPQPRYTTSQIVRGLFGKLPLYAYLEDSAAYRAVVTEEVQRKPDVVLCELTALFEPLRALGIDHRIVVDTHNIDSIVFERYARTQPTWARRLYSRVTARKLRRYEAEVFARVGVVLVCSEAEVAPVLQRAPAAHCVVVPNGADTEQVGDMPALPDLRRIFFFGRLDYHPNVDAIRFFLRSIFPLVRARRPDAELQVAGAGDDGTVEDMLSASPGATYLGRLEELHPVLAEAGVVIVPLRSGGGTRLKILEALAARRPVVSTTIGAEGLSLADTEIRLADDPVAFADAITFLMDHPEEANRLGARGRQAVEERYGWSAIGKALVRLLGEVARGELPPAVPR
jgi:glycosyltransferase involved in cell wall biosynthesis